MMRSLAGRLTLLVQGMAIAIVVAFALSSLWITARVLHARQGAFLEQTAKQLATGYDDELVEGDSALAVQGVLAEAAAAGVGVRIVDASGTELASSTGPLEKRVTLRLPFGAGRGADPLEAVALCGNGTRILVALSTAPLEASLSALAWSLAIAALPLLALGLLASRIAVRRALSPLSAMAGRAAAASPERGVISLGAPTGLEEIDRLGRSFDRLLQGLDAALRAERQFTADASHELRTPLTILTGELEMALAAAPQESALAGGLSQAGEQVRAMRELVDAILLLHRAGESGRSVDGFELLNLCDLAREAASETRLRHAGSSRPVELDVPDEILVSGHLPLLTSALRNLLDNALKFSPRESRVRMAVREEAGNALVVVDDQGPGIPPADRERVFDPFYRGAEARAGAGGSGLGLPILRRVARAHGGDVTVTDSPLGGARLELRLPLWRSG